MLLYFVCPHMLYIANIHCWWFCTLCICKWYCLQIVCWQLQYFMHNVYMSDCFYWFKFVWLYIAFSSNYIFSKEALKFIDIISLIPRPRPPCVAALQASLVETWEWDYKHYVYLWTILGQIMCGSSTVSLQHEEIVGAFQIIGVFHSFVV